MNKLIFPSSCVHENCLLTSYAMWIGMDWLLVSGAALLCLLVEPVAAGGGISEVMRSEHNSTNTHACIHSHRHHTSNRITE